MDHFTQQANLNGVEDKHNVLHVDDTELDVEDDHDALQLSCSVGDALFDNEVCR